MNIFKYILERIFKKKNTNQILKLQEKSKVQTSNMSNEDKQEFLDNLKSQVITSKKNIEIRERIGDGFGFKKNMDC